MVGSGVVVMGEQPTNTQPTNTLYCDIACPKCGKNVSSGIGFRAGIIDRRSYRLGDSLVWEGGATRPDNRPYRGNLKTIGYFECDNLKCETWADCYPEIQEALIIIKEDIISEAKPFIHRPNELVFDIIEPSE
jgi:hypothetical protein